MIDILIADDHAIVREGLKQIVSSQSDMNVPMFHPTYDSILLIICASCRDLALAAGSLFASGPAAHAISVSQAPASRTRAADVDENFHMSRSYATRE